MKSHARRSAAPTLLVVLFAFGLLSLTGRAGAAPQAVAYQIDPAHTGATAMYAFTFPLAKRWTVDLGQTVSYPLVAGGRVFVTVADNTSSVKRVVALDANNGSILWQQQIGGYYWRIDLCYENSTVFTINTDGLMQAWDAATGAAKWQKQMPGQYMFSSPPTAVNGVIYVGGAGSGGTLYAVRETDGTVLWTASVMNGDHSSPAVTSDGVYVSYAGPQVYKFSLSGAPVWHYNSGTEGGGGSTPAYYNNRLYVRSSGMGQTFDAGTGALLAGNFPGSPAPALDSDRMYVVSGNQVVARDLSTGNNIWAFTANYNEVAPPIVINGTVITADAGGWVHANDGATGRLLWEGNAGAPFSWPDEFNVSGVLTGMSAGEGLLAVPAGHLLTVFAPQTDTSPPTTTATVSGTQGTNGWYRSSVTVTLSATDNGGSGVAATYYAMNGAQATYTGPITLPGDATYGLTYWSVDNAGNTEPAQSLQVNIDGTPPTATFGAGSPAPNSAGWNNSAMSFPVQLSDNLSGISPSNNVTQMGVQQEGVGVTITFRVPDVAGNFGSFTTPPVNIDMTRPTTNASLSGTQAPNATYTGPVTVSLSATDSLSGVNATYYQIDNGSPQAYTGPIQVSADGFHTVGYWSVDKADNTESGKSVSFMIDQTPPTTTASASGPAGNNGWYTGAVTVTLGSSDPSGTNSYYDLDGAGQQLYTGPVSVTGDAVHSVKYWSVDGAGNTEAQQLLVVKIDATPPALSWGTPSPAANAGGWNNTAVNVPFTASDNLSGLVSGSPTGPLHLTFEGQGVTGTVTLTDQAGNSATFTSPAVNIDLTAPVITATASPATLSATGPKTKSVTVTGKITDALSGVLAGSATYVVSDEYGAVQPSGSITVAADGSYSFSVSLQTRKNKGDAARTYTITVKAKDLAGNGGSKSVVVNAQ